MRRCALGQVSVAYAAVMGVALQVHCDLDDAPLCVQQSAICMLDIVVGLQRAGRNMSAPQQGKNKSASCIRVVFLDAPLHGSVHCVCLWKLSTHAALLKYHAGPDLTFKDTLSFDSNAFLFFIFFAGCNSLYGFSLCTPLILPSGSTCR